MGAGKLGSYKLIVGNGRRDSSNIDATSFSPDLLLAMVTFLDFCLLIDLLSEPKVISSSDEVKERQVTSEIHTGVFDDNKEWI